jgi:hypothetical protein
MGPTPNLAGPVRIHRPQSYRTFYRFRYSEKDWELDMKYYAAVFWDSGINGMRLSVLPVPFIDPEHAKFCIENFIAKIYPSDYTIRYRILEFKL